MKYCVLPVLLFTFALTVIGCGTGGTTVPVAESTEFLAVDDQASLVAALQASGATVEAADSVLQAFFSPEGSIYIVNGVDVQVFEYESPEAMENEAAQVAPDGGSIGASMVTWVDISHFCKVGGIIVLYVGSDETVLGLLEQVLGTQFAGR